jgi:hypothetical protein
MADFKTLFGVAGVRAADPPRSAGLRSCLHLASRGRCPNGSQRVRPASMITFRVGAWAARFVCLLALEIWAGKRRESATVRARSSSSDPEGSGYRRSPRALGPEASAKAVALRAAVRRPESKGQKANQFSAGKWGQRSFPGNGTQRLDCTGMVVVGGEGCTR